MMMKSKVKTYVPLHICYFIYSLSLVTAKFAGQYPFFSLTAIGLYALAFFLLGVFALIWQQVLKRVPLTMAYANRAVTILYGMIFGAMLFSEKISWNMVLGAIIIVCGVVLMVSKYE